MGGKLSKPKAKKPSPHVTQLEKLEATLATTTDAEALGKLAREFHSVNYSLGHDIPAIINNPGIVDRATRGKVDANERAAAAYERAGNIRHAFHHLFEGLDAFPPRVDCERLAEKLAALLDSHDPTKASELRTEVAALRTVDDKPEAKQPFYKVVWRIKSALDWERLPRSSS